MTVAAVLATALAAFLALCSAGCSNQALDSPVASPETTVQGTGPTSAPADNEAVQEGGSGNKQWSGAATFAGSGWPLAAVAVAGIVGMVVYMVKTRRAKDSLVAIGTAVQDMGSSLQRDRLLKGIGTNADALGVKTYLDKTLAQNTLLVRVGQPDPSPRKVPPLEETHGKVRP